MLFGEAPTPYIPHPVIFDKSTVFGTLHTVSATLIKYEWLLAFIERLYAYTDNLQTRMRWDPQFQILVIGGWHPH